MPKPLFTMLQLSDAHLAGGADPNNTQGKLRAVLGRLGKGALAPAPDLVLLTGDVVDEPREEALRRFFAGLHDACPGARRLAVPGNHDAWPPDDPPDNAAFFRLAPADPRGEVVRFGGVTFILLNNADGDQCRTPRIAARNRWLAAALERHAAEPKIVAAHVPLVPLRDPEPLEAGFVFPTWVNRDGGELLGIIEDYADSVIAVLGGHLHLSGRVERAGIQHIVASGLMSWPGDVAQYNFFPDRIEGRMVGLDDISSGVPPSGGAVPCAAVDPGVLRRWPLHNGVYDRWACALTDARHPTAREFICGLEEERAFTIPLSDKKMIR